MRRFSQNFTVTAIRSWQMRSGSAHCDLELADEVRQCPLRSGAGEEARAAVIKSSHPHLAGGEKMNLKHGSRQSI